MKFGGLAMFCSICLSLIVVSFSNAEISLDDFAGVWLFDEGKGKVVGDFTENGNDGAFDGPKWIDGKFGKALEFDGSPKFVTIEHNDLFNCVRDTERRVAQP